MRLCSALIVLPLALLAHGGGQTKPLDAAAARNTIVELNKVWGKARVDQDRATMERMLAPEFAVTIGKQTISRKDFIDQNTAKSNGLALRRFDVDVLTVMPGADGAWVAVIAERLEIESTSSDGKKTTTYSLWVTRDTWRPAGGSWLAVSSEALGFESWRNGQKPPATVWG